MYTAKKFVDRALAGNIGGRVLTIIYRTGSSLHSHQWHRTLMALEGPAAPDEWKRVSGLGYVAMAVPIEVLAHLQEPTVLTPNLEGVAWDNHSLMWKEVVSGAWRRVY